MSQRTYCSVCQSPDREILVRQDLELPIGRCSYSGFNIVSCVRCGFIYADTCIDQGSFDAHYRAATYRYANEMAQQGESQVTLDCLSACVELLTPLLPAGGTVMDVGCGTGRLLSMFKDRGFQCRGVDQSGVMAEAGIRKYGVPIEVGSIFDVPINTEFDLVTSNHVLEHIVDLHAFLDRLWSLVKPEGHLYIEVPNAADFLRFADPKNHDDWLFIRDLYTHFTPEHINFFSPVSLANLMRRRGFVEVLCRGDRLGVITSLWRRCPIEQDNRTMDGVIAYDKASRRIQQPALDTILSVVKSGQPFYVWGAGLHTQRLLNHELKQANNIIAFIDIDTGFHGTTLAGKPIIAPETVEADVPILISSYRAEDKIKKYARKIGIQNRLVTLYSSPLPDSLD